MSEVTSLLVSWQTDCKEATYTKTELNALWTGAERAKVEPTLILAKVRKELQDKSKAWNTTWMGSDAALSKVQKVTLGTVDKLQSEGYSGQGRHLKFLLTVLLALNASEEQNDKAKDIIIELHQNYDKSLKVMVGAQVAEWSVLRNWVIFLMSALKCWKSELQNMPGLTTDVMQLQQDLVGAWKEIEERNTIIRLRNKNENMITVIEK